jgi:hypothetical protein
MQNIIVSGFEYKYEEKELKALHGHKLSDLNYSTEIPRVILIRKTMDIRTEIKTQKSRQELYF